VTRASRKANAHQRLRFTVKGWAGARVSWGDNGALKLDAALMYECCQILGLGLTNGVGDLLHHGAVSAATYELVGSAYAHVAACEPFLEQGQHLSELAMVVE